MNKEIYEKILFVDKILDSTVNPRTYRYFRDIKQEILKVDNLLEEKDKEIQELKDKLQNLEEYRYAIECMYESEISENEKLNNIIDTLRKDLLNYIEEWENVDDLYCQGRCTMARDVLHELEGDEDND